MGAVLANSSMLSVCLIPFIPTCHQLQGLSTIAITIPALMAPITALATLPATAPIAPIVATLPAMPAMATLSPISTMHQESITSFPFIS